jgi:hypothetical protein
MEAVNCWLWPGLTVDDVGLTEMDTAGDAVNVIAAEALFVESAWLTAVTVTVCCDATVDGAV